jgi:hypothetical protein
MRKEKLLSEIFRHIIVCSHLQDNFRKLQKWKNIFFTCCFPLLQNHLSSCNLLHLKILNCVSYLDNFRNG